MAARILDYRNEVAELLPQWLKTWAVLVALISPANSAYLNPEYVFPELISEMADHQSMLEAKYLGYPLFLIDYKVCSGTRFKKTRCTNSCSRS